MTPVDAYSAKWLYTTAIWWFEITTCYSIHIQNCIWQLDYYTKLVIKIMRMLMMVRLILKL